MKKFSQILLLVLMVSSSTMLGQIAFKQAYFIDNSGNKVSCLIKDVEWKSNPTNFEYKLTEDSSVQIANIANVQEFQIENFAKFIRKTVQMDRWDVFSPVTEQRESVYKTETLLLKEIVKGAATLYGYADGSFSTYFYEVNQAPMRQLVRKNYIIIDAIGNKRQYVNNMFKRQLYGDLKCDNITENQTKNVSYFEGDFVRFFNKYNSCMGETVEVAETGKTKIHLTIRPGVVQNSFKIDYPSDARKNIDFGSKTQLRVGLEAEIVLPFNRNKWSLLFEPVYTAFKGDGDQTTFTDNVDYKAIEFQMGVRHYMFLQPESRIFVNAGLVYPLVINDAKYFPKQDAFFTQYRPGVQVMLGAGYKFKKISGEFRYLGNQSLLADRKTWNSKFTSFAFVLGYEIF